MIVNTVRGRLFLAFGLVIAAFGAALGGAVLVLHDVGGELNRTATERLGKLIAVGQLESASQSRALLVRDLAINEDLKIQKELLAELKRLGDTRDDVVKGLRESSTDASQGAALEKALAAVSAVDKMVSELLSIIDEARFDDVKPFVLEKLRPKQALLDAEIRGLVASSGADANSAAKQTIAKVDSTVWILVSALGVTAFAALFTAWWVARSITGLLGAEPAELATVAKRLAEGDFTQRSEAPAGSVLGQLDRSRESLATLAKTIRQCAGSIEAVSTELSDSNRNLSVRTEQQASSLQQTAASMEEITHTVRESGDTARSANEQSDRAATVAESGGAVVVEVVAQMRQIQESSRKIAEIISVIDGIAFQTNILALNAAVEAARAGEQGRGFAVVATEVRALAQRSASAAHQIKDLISGAVSRIDSGANQAEIAGATISDVVKHVTSVATMIASIAEATSEQSKGIAQVNDSMTQLDRMTQQNAALVEESSAAAESLSAQAKTLSSAVSVFRV